MVVENEWTSHDSGKHFGYRELGMPKLLRIASGSRGCWQASSKTEDFDLKAEGGAVAIGSSRKMPGLDTERWQKRLSWPGPDEPEFWALPMRKPVRPSQRLPDCVLPPLSLVRITWPWNGQDTSPPQS